MKNTTLRILVFVISLMLLAAFGFSGCKTADSTATETKVAGEKTQEAEVTAEPEETQVEKTTVTIWSLWTDGNNDVNAQAFRRVLEKAKTDLPNIEIEHYATENEAYKTKLKTAMAANEVGDVFKTWGAGFLQPFVEAEKVLALDDYLQDGTMDRIMPGSLEYFSYDEKVYGLPSYMWVGVLYCNKELFEENGIKMPDTYEELLTAVKAFREKDIQPIAVGEKDRWPGIFWYDALAVRTAGIPACLDALFGETSYDQPEFVKAAEMLEELVNAGAFMDGCMALTYDEGHMPFLQGEVPMYYMGDWFVGDIMSENSVIQDKVVCKLFPSVAGEKGKVDEEFLGGAIDGFCVYEGAEDVDASVTVLKYITEGMAIDQYETGSGIPTWYAPEGLEAQYNDIYKQIIELIENGKLYVDAWDTFLGGNASDVHKNLVAEIFGGVVTPEDYAKRMQEEINEQE